MNATPRSRILSGLSAAILLLGPVSVGHAGPGAGYWQRAPKLEETKPLPKPSCPLDATCPASQIVRVTQVRPTWPNARGPLEIVELGFKRVCYTCGGTTVTLRSINGNGRPPYEFVRVPAKHDCTDLIVTQK